MAEDCILMRCNLADDPAVISIANELELTTAHVVGLLHQLWSWASCQTRDGNAPFVTFALLDAHVGVTGLCESMSKRGWLTQNESGIVVPDFDRYMSDAAKTRVATRFRVQKHRRKAVTPRAYNGVTSALPGNGTAPFVSAVVVTDNSSNNKKGAALDFANGWDLLLGEGFDAATATELWRLDTEPGLIERSIRNADYLAAEGKLTNRLGYLRKAIESKYPLHAALAAMDAQGKRRQRRSDREAAERRKRAKEEEARIAESKRIDAALRAMPADELADTVEDALAQMKPSVRRVVGDCRDPFENNALRAFVAKVMKERVSRSERPEPAACAAEP